ncbi:MAG: hypothetical protein RRC07_02925 [Anaerolineae bacterium]|nr:hypothetical protein [Anaerolineae bacterium]
MRLASSLRWLFVLFLFLSLPALACGLISGDDEEPTEVSPAVVEETAGDGETAPAEEEAPATPVQPVSAAPAFSDLRTAAANLENFDSYRLDMTLAFEGSSEGEAQSGTMHFQSAIVAEPRASQVIVTFEGDISEEMEGAESITFTEIGDLSYTVFPGFGCITGSTDEGDTAGEFDNLADTGELFGEIRDADYVGEETIRGVPTFHYRFDESDVEQDSDMEEMDGHIYIAQDGGYVVRMLVDGRGALDLFGEETEASTIHLQYDITDVNTPIAIAPPEECDDLAAEFPVMPGATGMASMAGFTSYEVEATRDEVMAFYEEEMPRLGYSSEGEQTLVEGFALLNYSQDSTSVTITLTEEDGVVSVLITSVEE